MSQCIEGPSAPKRAMLKLVRPNPLFELWLEEWRKEAANRNSGIQETYAKALKSLRKYPLVLNSGKECIVLEHFDTQLCIKLDSKLSQYKRALSERESSNEVGTSFESGTSSKSLDGSNSSQKKRRKTGRVKPKRSNIAYVPEYKSAAFAFLVTLYKDELGVGYMSKAELMRHAEPLSRVGLKSRRPGSYYTGWSSMVDLIRRGLVYRKGNPARFSLSQEGRDLASKLSVQLDKPWRFTNFPSYSEEPVRSPTPDMVSPLDPDLPKVIKRPSSPSEEDESSEDEEGVSMPVERRETDDVMGNVLVPGSFEIVLLVDSAETLGETYRYVDDTISALEATGVPFEVRNLKVGDYAWIVRQVPRRDPDVELVLPCIVERKTLPDLAKSIKDGRFKEQKFRLRHCGLPNLIYLVEENPDLTQTSIPMSSLLQAAVNTQVVDKFVVKMTSSHRDSISYLATMTEVLTSMYKKRLIAPCRRNEIPRYTGGEYDIISLWTFRDFSRDNGKNRNWSVKEMFVKMLVQLHGMSSDKAWAVASEYKTPAALRRALKSLGAAPLAALKTSPPPFARKLGPSLATVLQSLYLSPSFPS